MDEIMDKFELIVCDIRFSNIASYADLQLIYLEFGG